jgi:hyperosmotically inducible protein
MKTTCSTFPMRKSVLLSVLIATALTAGLGVSSASAETAAPQAHSDGVGAAISDTAITAKVKAKLTAESKLDKSDISVTTTNGVVTLEGTASNPNAREMAEVLAKTVDDVKSVDNSLKVPGGSKAVAKTKRVANDSWITTKVKSELLADSISKGAEVSVETMHGVVVLKGTLANPDAVEHVKNIAAKVEGVKSVDTSELTSPLR